MRVKDYIKTNTDLIPVGFESYISSVLDELYAIRANREATEEYCNKIDRISWILKQSLIQITEKDPSYGYFYNHFARILNGQHKCEIYHCVLDYNIINFYIDFCWDDLEEQIAGLSNEGKLSILIKKKAECKKSNFNDDLKNKYIENCEAEICMIKDLISLSNISSDINNKNDNNLSDTTNSVHMLFDKSFIDGLKPFSNRLFLCNNTFLVFNKPYECEIEVKILDREIKRTQYLLNKMHKYISKKFPENHDIAVEWLKSISNRFGLTVESIKKVGLPKYDKSDSFKNDIDNYFAFIDPE